LYKGFTLIIGGMVTFLVIVGLLASCTVTSTDTTSSTSSTQSFLIFIFIIMVIAGVVALVAQLNRKPRQGKDQDINNLRKVPTTMYCSKCGTQSSEGDVFCRKCGLPLKQMASNPDSSQTPPPPLSTYVSGGARERRTAYIPESISDKLPSMVRVELSKLTPEKQSLFLEEFRRKKKNTGIAYLLWFIIGLHYIYLGKIGWQFFYWITLGGIGVWAFIDLFRIPGMVNNNNRDVAIDVIRDLKVISS